MINQLPFSEACERNKAPILEVLLEELPGKGRLLEIGSGTGQHLVHFAPHFPGLMWQPSDQPGQLEGLAARIPLEAPPNVLPAIELDVLRHWPPGKFDAIFSSNTAHIMSWAEVSAMLAGAGALLHGHGIFCLYGPFNEGGGFTAPGNAEFDWQLRARDPEMGLRDIEALDKLGAKHKLVLQRKYDMPANNMLLVFMKLED